MFKPYFPPHVYQDNTIYFITAHTRDNKEILTTKFHKIIFRDIFTANLTDFKMENYAWTINTNHYHILVKISKSSDLSKFIRNIHGQSSLLLNRFDQRIGRKIWVNYWDRCIRSEPDFYTRLNYIHYNSVKHNYVANPQDYEWSSYKFYLQKYGQEWIDECFIRYPVKEFTLECPD